MPVKSAIASEIRPEGCGRDQSQQTRRRVVETLGAFVLGMLLVSGAKASTKSGEGRDERVRSGKRYKFCTVGLGAVA